MSPDKEHELLQETLRNSEEVRSPLALDKERLEVELKRIVEKKMKLEEEAKHQHQQLKELQKNVFEKLKKVESTHESDQFEIKKLRDEVISLERELSITRDEVHQLTKNLDQKGEIENNLKELSREKSQDLHAQINKLHEEVTVQRIELQDVEHRYKKDTVHLEDTIDSIHLEMSEILKARDAEIEKLNIVSQEKDSMSQRLEKEKEQLVLSMQDMMKNRRDEVDDLRNELMEMNTRLANQTREISTLNVRVEESNYQTKEMGSLRARVAELSNQLATKKEFKDGFETSSLEIENSELRRRLKDESTERWMAEDKLQKCISDRGNGGSSRSVQLLRERNAALRLEVEKLRKKLKKISEKASVTSDHVELEPYSVGNGVTRMAI